jgi:methionine synthase I (cobalamin-dependent)
LYIFKTIFFSSSDSVPVVIYPEGIEAFSSFMAHVIDLGIDFAGGCCGTTPEHIKAMDEMRRKAFHGHE